MALLGTLSTHCMGPGRCQLRHPVSHPGSWSGWGWRLASPGPPGPAHCLGLMASPEAQLQPHVLSWGAGAWGRELRGGTILTLPASGGHPHQLIHLRGSLSGSNDTEAEEMLCKLWIAVERLCGSDSQ